MSQVRANSITNAAGTGAPDFPNGLTSGGVTVSPGTQTFTASGSVAAGDVVAVNSDGTVSKVNYTTDSNNRLYLAASAKAVNANQENVIGGPNNSGAGGGIVSFSDTTAVSAFFEGTSNTWRARVLTIGSDGSITPQTPVTFATAALSNWWGVVKVSATTFAVFYSTSGTTVSMVVGQVSGTTITFGSPVTVSSGVGWGTGTFETNGSGGILFVQHTTATNTPLRVCAISVSGTTATVGAFTTLRSTAPATSLPTVAYDPVNAVFLVNAVQSGSPFSIMSWAVTISGTTVLAGGAYTVFGNEYTYYTNAWTIYDPTSARFVVCNPAVTGTTSRIYTATISSYVITASAQTTDVTGNSTGFIPLKDGKIIVGVVTGTEGSHLTFDPLNSFKPILTPLNYTFSPEFWNSRGIEGSPFYCFQQTSSGATYRTYAFSSVTSYVGVADETVASGQPVKTVVSGGICENLSGLSVGRRYYVSPAGNLTTTYQAVSYIGTAMSSTSLLVGPDFGY